MHSLFNILVVKDDIFMNLFLMLSFTTGQIRDFYPGTSESVHEERKVKV